MGTGEGPGPVGLGERQKVLRLLALRRRMADDEHRLADVERRQALRRRPAQLDNLDLSGTVGAAQRLRRPTPLSR